MYLRKLKVSLILVVLLLTTTLVGCGREKSSTSNGSEQTISNTQSTDSSKTKEQVTDPFEKRPPVKGPFSDLVWDFTKNPGVYPSLLRDTRNYYGEWELIKAEENKMYVLQVNPDNTFTLFTNGRGNKNDMVTGTWYLRSDNSDSATNYRPTMYLKSTDITLNGEKKNANFIHLVTATSCDKGGFIGNYMTDTFFDDLKLALGSMTMYQVELYESKIPIKAYTSVVTDFKVVNSYNPSKSPETKKLSQTEIDTFSRLVKDFVSDRYNFDIENFDVQRDENLVAKWDKNKPNYKEPFVKDLFAGGQLIFDPNYTIRNSEVIQLEILGMTKLYDHSTVTNGGIALVKVTRKLNDKYSVVLGTISTSEGVSGITIYPNESPLADTLEQANSHYKLSDEQIKTVMKEMQKHEDFKPAKNERAQFMDYVVIEVDTKENKAGYVLFFYHGQKGNKNDNFGFVSFISEDGQIKIDLVSTL